MSREKEGKKKSALSWLITHLTFTLTVLAKFNWWPIAQFRVEQRMAISPTSIFYLVLSTWFRLQLPFHFTLFISNLFCPCVKVAFFFISFSQSFFPSWSDYSTTTTTIHERSTDRNGSVVSKWSHGITTELLMLSHEWTQVKWHSSIIKKMWRTWGCFRPQTTHLSYAQTYTYTNTTHTNTTHTHKHVQPSNWHEESVLRTNSGQSKSSSFLHRWPCCRERKREKTTESKTG